MFYEQLDIACKANNTTITALTKSLKMSTGNVTRWKNGGMPSIEVLIQLSDALNVSTDYLLGREEQKPKLKLIENEKENVKMFDEEKKNAIVSYSNLVNLMECQQFLIEANNNEKVDKIVQLVRNPIFHSAFLKIKRSDAINFQDIEEIIENPIVAELAKTTEGIGVGDVMMLKNHIDKGLPYNSELDKIIARLPDIDVTSIKERVSAFVELEQKQKAVIARIGEDEIGLLEGYTGLDKKGKTFVMAELYRQQERIARELLDEKDA